MSYAAIRDRIRSGDLLSWSHDRWDSWYDFKVQMVRMATQSEYCHVGIAWVTAGRVFVLEAVQPRIRIFPLSSLRPFYWLPMGITWTPELEEFAMVRVGDPYSEWQAMAAFFNHLASGADRVWQCAEYVDQILKTAGINLACKPVPTDIVRAAQRLGAPLELAE